MPEGWGIWELYHGCYLGYKAKSKAKGGVGGGGSDT